MKGEIGKNPDTDNLEKSSDLGGGRREFGLSSVCFPGPVPPLPLGPPLHFGGRSSRLIRQERAGMTLSGASAVNVAST